MLRIIHLDPIVIDCKPWDGKIHVNDLQDFDKTERIVGDNCVYSKLKLPGIDTCTYRHTHSHKFVSVNGRVPVSFS